MMSRNPARAVIIRGGFVEWQGGPRRWQVFSEMVAGKVCADGKVTADYSHQTNILEDILQIDSGYGRFTYSAMMQYIFSTHLEPPLDLQKGQVHRSITWLLIRQATALLMTSMS